MPTLPSLVLASGSPRRAALLSAAGIPFQTLKPDIAETADRHLTARELTAWNAVRKGMTVARRHPNRVVIAADTVVALNGAVIGKPSDLADAIQILRRLRGRTHHVYSSVFVAQLASARTTLFSDLSRVRFKQLSERQISDYVSKIDPLDKAGAYAAQGDGSEIILWIEGSYSNVVGLPMERTIPVLKQFGIEGAPRPNRRWPVPAGPQRAGAGVHAAKHDTGTTR